MSARATAVLGVDLRPVIDGDPFDGGSFFSVIDPATADTIVQVSDVGPDGIDNAVAAARRAHRAWARVEPRVRAAALLELANLVERESEQLSTVEALDTGKPIALTPAEITSSVDKIRFFAGACRVLPGAAANGYRAPFQSHVRRESVGVVAALAPWNYPFALAIWKVIPALAVGNTVVLKPAPETPLTSLLLGHLARKVLPPGVLNVVCGGSATGEALVRHADVDMVSLTGGTNTGKKVMRSASDSLKRLHLELGGNAPVLVFDDADLGRLEQAYFMAAFRNSGQDCHAASRIYTSPRMVEQVATTVRRVIDEQVRLGDNFEPGTNMGPLVSRGQYDRITGLVNRALALDHVEAMPARNDQAVPIRGFYCAPTVLVGARQNDEIVQHEIFGPVVTITACEDEDEAIAYANGTAFGLAASIWTRDIDRALRVANSLRVGTIWINGHGATIAEMPFGGVKESGFGRDLGTAALEQHTELKHIAIAVQERSE